MATTRRRKTTGFTSESQDLNFEVESQEESFTPLAEEDVEEKFEETVIESIIPTEFVPFTPEPEEEETFVQEQPQQPVQIAPPKRRNVPRFSRYN